MSAIVFAVHDATKNDLPEDYAKKLSESLLSIKGGYFEKDGALLANLVRDVTRDRPYPKALRTVPKRFPLSPYRRHLIRPLYQWTA